MILTSPLWLVLLPASLLVFWLHRHRRRHLTVASTRIWRALTSHEHAQSASQRAPADLLTLVRFALLVTIIVSLAGPTVRSPDEQASHWVVLLDTSASMLATDTPPSRFEQVRAEAQQLIDRLPGASEGGPVASLIEVSAMPRLVALRESDPHGLRASLAGVTASHTAADWTEAATTVERLLEAGEDIRVWVFTDPAGQAEAHDLLTSRFGSDTLRWTTIGTAATNLALHDLVVTAPTDDHPWRIEGSVIAHGSAPTEVLLGVWFDPDELGTPLPWTERTIVLGSDERTPFRLDLDLPAGGLLELRLPPDALEHDNQAYARISAEPRTLDVLLVGGGAPDLRRLLAGLPYIRLTENPDVPADSSRHDLVILNSTTSAHHPRTNTLWIATTPVGVEGIQRLEPADPSGWDDDHPLAVGVDLSLLTIDRAVALPRLHGAHVLLEASGVPLIQARTGPHGREVAIGFTLEDSNWLEQLSLVIFLDNLARWIDPDVGLQVAQGCQVARSCALDPRQLETEGRLLNPWGDELMLPRQVGPAGLYDPVGPAFLPMHAGVYRWSAGGGARALIVHAPSSPESDLRGASVGPVRRSLTVRPLPSPRLLLIALAIVLLLTESVLTCRGMRGCRRSELRRLPRLAPGVLLRLAALTAVALAVFAAPVPIREAREAQVILLAIAPDASDVDTEHARALLQYYDIVRREGVSLIEVGPIDADRLGLPPRRERLSVSGLSEGLGLAAALLSRDRPGRLTIITDDGLERPSLLRALEPLAAARVPVDVHALGTPDPLETWVAQLTSPQQVYAGDPTALSASIATSTAGPANIRVSRDGVLVAEQEVTLTAGSNRVDLPLTPSTAGRSTYEVEIQREGDRLALNNRRSIVVEVRHAPRVTLFATDSHAAALFRDALAIHGLRAEIIQPNRIPHYMDHANPSVPGWLDRDVVVLMNLPADDLTWSQQEMLQRWVRDEGGGLLLLGGERSFGPGGYHQTLLEEVLPLATKIPDEKPVVAICFVIDRSGSMLQAVGEVSRLDVAKRATLDAIGLLDGQSLVGIVAFDSEARVLVPMQPADRIVEIEEYLRPLVPGGGTAIHPGLVLALEQMQGVDTELTRHVVVMTDGLSQPGDFDDVVQEIADRGITLSTAAIGEGADVRLLARLARFGGGVSHATTDFEALPSILAQETLLLSDELVREIEVVPLRETAIPFLDGLPEPLPPLQGWTRTTAKPGADVHLRAGDEEPLMASWRYGAGRVVAFASHGAGPWSRDWVAQSYYPLLWAQTIRWLLPATQGGWRLTATENSDQLLLSLEAKTLDRTPETGHAIEAVVTTQDGNAVTLDLTEVEAGLYQAAFRPSRSGQHRIRVDHPNAGEDGRLETSFEVSYDSRYAYRLSGVPQLEALALATGGELLGVDAPLLEIEHEARWGLRSAWRPWLVAALLLISTAWTASLRWYRVGRPAL